MTGPFSIATSMLNHLKLIILHDFIPFYTTSTTCQLRLASHGGTCRSFLSDWARTWSWAGKNANWDLLHHEALHVGISSKIARAFQIIICSFVTWVNLCITLTYVHHVLSCLVIVHGSSAMPFWCKLPFWQVHSLWPSTWKSRIWRFEGGNCLWFAFVNGDKNSPNKYEK